MKYATMCCLMLHCRHFSLCHSFLQEWFQRFSTLTTENWALGSEKQQIATWPLLSSHAWFMPNWWWPCRSVFWTMQMNSLYSQERCLPLLPALLPEFFHVRQDILLSLTLHLLPVCHRRALSLALGQGEAILSQVELQTPSLHQPVRCLEDLRGQGLRLAPLLRALAGPGSSFGHNAPRGGGSFGLLTDAIQVFHWVFASFTSSGSTTAGKHYYLQSDAADWWKRFLSFVRFCLQHLLWAKNSV